MRTTNYEVALHYLSGLGNCHSDNMHHNGVYCYSYSTPIAGTYVLEPSSERVVFVIDHPDTKTTGKHRACVTRAANQCGMKVLHIPPMPYYRYHEIFTSSCRPNTKAIFDECIKYIIIKTDSSSRRKGVANELKRYAETALRLVHDTSSEECVVSASGFKYNDGTPFTVLDLLDAERNGYVSTRPLLKRSKNPKIVYIENNSGTIYI